MITEKLKWQATCCALNTLVAETGRERFGAEYDKAVKSTAVAPRGADEKTQAAPGATDQSGGPQAHHALVGP